MHMSDSLVSLIVGGAMWVISAGGITFGAKKLKNSIDEKKLPLMSVMGAFIFAAQMINFTIPFTGSSGHISGGMVLSIILGPYAGVLTLSSVLIIQALFFADGGLLSLGSNIFNIAFIPSFIVLPFVFNPIRQIKKLKNHLSIPVIISCIIALQLGSLGVVLQTYFSGISELSFNKFVLLMQPIHLAIGIVEGLVTLSLITLIKELNPEIIDNNANKKSFSKLLIIITLFTILTGGVLSWYASSNPDGLEWSVMKVLNGQELNEGENKFQDKTAILPDYNLKEDSLNEEKLEDKKNINSNIGTSLSGIIGGGITIFFIGIFSIFLKKCCKFLLFTTTTTTTRLKE